MEPLHKNFELALEKLTAFVRGYDGSEIHRAGVIQAFEFTYEQCWHLFQKKAGKEGLSIATPKKAFEYALKAGVIRPEDELLWLTMLDDRNKTTHTYRSALAEEVFTKISKDYLPAFAAVLKKITHP